MVPGYDFPFTKCRRIQIFSSMTLHVAPWDGFLGTQRTVIWTFHSMNLHVVLSVVCGCMVFAIYIPNIHMITMNNMLHFMLPSSHFFMYFRVFLHSHMLCQPLFRRVCSVALITIKLMILHSQSENRNLRNHDCIPKFLSIFSILSRFSFLYWLSCSFIDFIDSLLLQKCHQYPQLLWLQLTSPPSLVF